MAQHRSSNAKYLINLYYVTSIWSYYYNLTPYPPIFVELLTSI